MEYTKYNQGIQRTFSNEIEFPGVKRKATLAKLKGYNTLIFLLDKEIED